MNSKTQELTYGAMLAAVFGVMLLLNRQTGGLFEEFIFFILPIPLAVFTLRYGWKDGLPVLASMIGLSVFLGTPYTLFYAAGNAIIGLVLGAMLKSRRDSSQTQMVIMLLATVLNVLGTVVLASLFGLSVQAEVQELHDMMMPVFVNSGIPAESYEAVMGFESLRRLYIISMCLLGIMQGFVIFRLSLVIMKKLRLPVPSLMPTGSYYPPRWTGAAALFLLLLYQFSYNQFSGQERIQAVLQSAGLCGSFYLMIFGWIALLLCIHKAIPGHRFICMILALLCMLLFSVFVSVLGFAYIISPSFHDGLLQPGSGLFSKRQTPYS